MCIVFEMEKQHISIFVASPAVVVSMHARVEGYPGLGLVVLGRVDVGIPAFGGW